MYIEVKEKMQLFESYHIVQLSKSPLSTDVLYEISLILWQQTKQPL
jgi:hypothetical protein